MTVDRRQGLTSGVAIKAPCRVATTANITLSGLQTIDGVTVAADDRVLVKSQTNAVQNGIYLADTGSWQRAVDFNGPRDVVQGTLVLVTAGSSLVEGRKVFELNTASPVIGTSSLTFTATGFPPQASTVVSMQTLGEYDGDGVGGGTDNTTALQAAILLAGSSGIVDFGDFGTFRIDGQVDWGSTRMTRRGANLDFSNRVSGGHSFRWQGSYGAEVNLSIAAARGDTQITTAAAHGLQQGDFFRLTGTMRMLTSDASEAERLGEVTSSSTSPYLSEVLKVKNRVSDTVVDVEGCVRGISYALTGSGARSISTIKKCNYLAGSLVSGFGEVICGTAHAFRIEIAHKAKVEAGTVWVHDDRPGASIYALGCKQCVFETYPGATHSNPDLSSDHSDYNDFLDVGGDNNEWWVYGENGAQLFDATYTSAGDICIAPRVRGGWHMHSGYDGLTFHSGCWGGAIENFRAVAPLRSGIRQNSRFVEISNPELTGPNQFSIAGIESQGYAIDGKVIGGIIDGFTYGYRHDRQGVTGVGPARINMYFGGGLLVRNATRGIYLAAAPAGSETADACDVFVDGVRFAHTVDYGLYVGDYNNYGRARGLVSGVTTGSAPFVVYLDSETVGWRIGEITGGVEAAAGLVRIGSLGNTAPLLTATFTHSRHIVDLDSLSVTGSGFKASLGTTYSHAPGGNITLSIHDMGKPIRATAACDITVPPNADVAFPRETLFEIATSTASVVQLVAGSGVSINPSGTLKLDGQYAVAYLRKVGTDSWILSGKITA